MSQNPRPWLLPSGFEDILPARAERLEALRRELLDLYRCWGYQQVIPPLAEHLETLLTGVGQELELQTLKLVDQETGRMLGLRSDLTPQVARIDAHRFHADVPNRLCYAGTVLRATADHYGGSRAPFQVGAELFGVDSASADVEVATLMIESLRQADVRDLVLDLGHVGVFRALLRDVPLSPAGETLLYHAMQRRAVGDVREALQALAAPGAVQEQIVALLQLSGERSVLDEARRLLPDAPAPVQEGLQRLGYIHDQLTARFAGLRIQIDLAELRGYRYHTGPIFSAYTPGSGTALASGGRYNDIGAAFGRGRPATGFSLDLKQLIAPQQSSLLERIWAPGGSDPALATAILDLRRAGRVVIQSVNDSTTDDLAQARALACQYMLAPQDGRWQVVALP
ncbi:MAG: ATP phosphoribosyltransferase regulatory subunit [Pseudomonadota bacterium]